MNANPRFFPRFLTGHSEKDVFTNTQGRLTRIYSGLLMVFLALFILIVYSVLYVVILKNQEQELQTFVQQEAGIIENYLLRNDQSDLQDLSGQEVIFAGVNQFFYYVVSPSRGILMGNETDSRLRPELQRLVSKQVSYDGEIQKATLHIAGNPKGRGNRGEFREPEAEKDLRLMIANKSIYFKGKYIGQLYIGKDISFAYQLFHWLLFIFIAIGIVFFGVALYMSSAMSKRAMGPIRLAFKRQREFVADASHELRTPLSVLLSSVEALEMTVEPAKEDPVWKMLTNMKEEVKRMTHLVSDLLTLARSDSNAVELKLEKFDWTQLIEKTIESVRPLSLSKQISLNFNALAPQMVVGDFHRCSQLVYIILDNAIKYTPEKGEVRVALSNEGNQFCMTVQDTGIGIKKEDYQRIFDRFYRAEKSRSRQMGGHGLGLSIAKWIVDMHKGTIHVSSDVGKGSTFTVRIPNK
ncbi:ATP-binding protein [Neobacillus rhizosphaerae]|uniref:sensor histidine kinase n=1 Tax=Neobacillus rhizosphaerae TaxID=2880965 RepID=UPI003D2C647F